ncbi:MAG: EamA family transporter [Thermodesulfobacteriota bacterium]|nr:EamA family transporter [Thermodesulfobacteriota bacterium]
MKNGISESNRWKGYLYISLAASLWGLLGPLAKLAFQEGVSPLEVAFWRAFLAWFLFGTQALVQKTTRVDKRDLPGLSLFGFVSVALFFGSYQVAVDRGGAALASVLLYTAPAWVFLFSRIFLKERFTGAKLSALCLTIFGVVMISLNQGQGALGRGPGVSAIFFGLLAGFCYSLYYIMGKHYSERYSAPVLFLYILPVGAISLLPMFTFAEKTATAWFALGCIALFSTYGAYHFYYAGLKRIEAGRASIVATLEPVMAAVVAWFWWGESFSASGYMGSTLIVLAVVIMIRH